VNNLSGLSSRAQTIRAARRHGVADAHEVANNPTYDRPNDDYDFSGSFTDITSSELRVPDRWVGVFQAEYARAISRVVRALESQEG
jgi:hypothetical protein